VKEWKREGGRKVFRGRDGGTAGPRIMILERKREVKRSGRCFLLEGSSVRFIRGACPGGILPRHSSTLHLHIGRKKGSKINLLDEGRRNGEKMKAYKVKGREEAFSSGGHGLLEGRGIKDFHDCMGGVGIRPTGKESVGRRGGTNFAGPGREDTMDRKAVSPWEVWERIFS